MVGRVSRYEGIIWGDDKGSVTKSQRVWIPMSEMDISQQNKNQTYRALWQMPK